jgi:hypothetical protein
MREAPDATRGAPDVTRGAPDVTRGAPPAPPPEPAPRSKRAAFLEAHGLPPDFEPGDAYEGPEIPEDDVHEEVPPEKQPRMMTHDQIGRYLAMRPSTRRYFELDGKLSRRLIDEYDWLWNGSRVVLIPTWFGQEGWQTHPNATASSGA